MKKIETKKRPFCFLQEGKQMTTNNHFFELDGLVFWLQRPYGISFASDIIHSAIEIDAVDHVHICVYADIDLSLEDVGPPSNVCVVDGSTEGKSNTELISTRLELVSSITGCEKIFYLTQNFVIVQRLSNTIFYHGFTEVVVRDRMKENYDDDIDIENADHRFLLLGGFPRAGKILFFMFAERHGFLDNGRWLWSCDKLEVMPSSWKRVLEEKSEEVQRLISDGLLFRFISRLPCFIDIDCSNKTVNSAFTSALYHRGQLMVVLETDFTTGTLNQRYTEKVIKCIAAKRPFIVVGNPYTLKHLRAQGYRTFSPIIDESYDIEPGILARMKCIMELCEQLDAMDDENFISKILNPCRDICDFNHCHLLDEDRRLRDLQNVSYKCLLDWKNK